MEARFNKTSDYKTEFNDAVTELIEQRIQPREKRIQAINALIDEYVTVIEKVPCGRQLERLTDEILREELTDTHPDKMTREEYPIMSDNQYRRKTLGMHVRRTDESGNTRALSREVPLSLAGSIGTDGKNYAYPSKRVLDVDETIHKEGALKVKKRDD